MKLLKNKWVIALVAVLVIGISAAFTYTRKEKPEYFTGHAERGDIREVVEATGTINAVTSVQVGSQVSGTISKLYADFNSHVKKGQLIAQIDPALFEGTLLQTKADLENAKANLAVSKANLEKAKATAEQTRADFVRTEGLAKEGVMSAQQLDLARANADSAEAGVSAAKAQVTQAAAQVSQKAAAVTVAQTNLNYTHIHAPIEGVVVNRAVDVGQTVAASLQAPTLFTIAQDLTKMQVYAKTDEADVGQIRSGQVVTFKVDAFPKDVFRGTVMQVRMNPTTVQNVVTYDTIVNFDNPELKLFPGMTAYITIPVASRTDVVKVPNGALRYKPDLKPDQLNALYAKYGFEKAGGGKGGPGGGGATGRQYRAAQASEQKGGAEQSRAKPPDVAVVWKLHPDKTLEPVRVKTGITDHTVTEVTEVLKGALKEGDELVIGSATVSARPGTGAPGGMGGPPRR